MVLEYLNKIGYKNGKVMQGFLISLYTNIQELAKTDKKIIILGVCENGFYAEKLLQEVGIETYAYADNAQRLQGRKIRGKQIYSPYEIFKDVDEYYLIIAVQSNNIACVRLQFMTHGVNEYSIFLNTEFHDFIDENVDIQDNILGSINEICFLGEKVEEALPQVGIEMGKDGSQLGKINWLLKSTEWSHWAYLWGEKLLSNNRNKVLEIGPGYGLMTAVLMRMYQNISVDWIIFGSEDELLRTNRDEYAKSLQKVKEKYKERIKTKYGYIEMGDYTIRDKYDLIIMTEVFEHFALNPVNTIRKLAAALKDGGRIILTTPNWGHIHIYDSWTELQNGEEITDIDYLRLIECGHIYQYSKDELFSVFKQAGLSVEKYELSDSNNHNFVLRILD